MPLLVTLLQCAPLSVEISHCQPVTAASLSLSVPFTAVSVERDDVFSDSTPR